MEDKKLGWKEEEIEKRIGALEARLSVTESLLENTVRALYYMKPTVAFRNYVNQLEKE